MKWHLLPWKFFVRRAARSYGFVDPAGFMARMSRFARPAEFEVPMELLRAGVIFHARGLINTRAIQHNLDWVWPFWVERQFNPRDPSFLPRAFNFSHVNLTHRNWTAVGLPDIALYPLIDPRGLVTPLFDGWSIDFWVLGADGTALLPGRAGDTGCKQRLHPENQVVETRIDGEGMRLRLETRVELHDHAPVLRVEARGDAERAAWLVVALRPYNPEGIQFIDTVRVLGDRAGWRVNNDTDVLLSEYPSNWYASNYAGGDVFHHLPKGTPQMQIRCPVGMATAAALFPIAPGHPRMVTVSVPLDHEAASMHEPLVPRRTWREVHETAAKLRLPDRRCADLYAASINTLELLTAGEAYPGPYTYRRFWFRDACLMLNSLLAAGLIDRVKRHLSYFPERQKRDGYFASQEGEWDSNGQVLWLLGRYAEVSGEVLPEPWLASIERAVGWIERKRVRAPGEAHDGLLPSGFSAEHFGPNNHYYWDAFWSVGGLRAVEPLLRAAGRDESAQRCARVAQELMTALEISIGRVELVRAGGTVPAAPDRRMDSGAIGVLVADYPLRLLAPGDPRMRNTAAWFMEHSLVGGGFFQDMQHSGINAYLTLMLAQTLLRNGDGRWADLVRAVARLASPTGQWPEAIHPLTGGGCIGDGQHGWAAAEWVLWMRNAFLREDNDGWIIGSGLLPEWLTPGARLEFGPTPVAGGSASVRLVVEDADLIAATIVIDGAAALPARRYAVPGFIAEARAASAPCGSAGAEETVTLCRARD